MVCVSRVWSQGSGKGLGKLSENGPPISTFLKNIQQTPAHPLGLSKSLLKSQVRNHCGFPATFSTSQV